MSYIQTLSGKKFSYHTANTEATVDYLVRRKFGLPKIQSPEVKQADLVMLATERRDLGIDDGSKWECLDGICPTHKFCIDPLRPVEARELFMNRFRELKFGCWEGRKIKDLVHAGHDIAAELKAECGSVNIRETAQLIRDLATQLDVTFLALTESERLRKIDSEVRHG